MSLESDKVGRKELRLLGVMKNTKKGYYCDHQVSKHR